jgi:hypothetical protein
MPLCFAGLGLCLEYPINSNQLQDVCNTVSPTEHSKLTAVSQESKNSRIREETIYRGQWKKLQF